MLRPQLLRQLRKPKRLSCLNATRTFTATPQRKAEVELTIGMVELVATATPMR